MILPDVNVLIYAYRSDVPQHAVCRRWLDDVVAGDARFGISKLALAAVVRVITNARIHRTPASLPNAFAFCDNLLQQPHCVIVEPGEQHWEILRRLCMETGVKGPGVTDAWYAALAIEWACEWVTCDRDFLRYPGLSCTILPARSV